MTGCHSSALPVIGCHCQSIGSAGPSPSALPQSLWLCQWEGAPQSKPLPGEVCARWMVKRAGGGTLQMGKRKIEPESELNLCVKHVGWQQAQPPQPLLGLLPV